MSNSIVGKIEDQKFIWMHGVTKRNNNIISCQVERKQSRTNTFNIRIITDIQMFHTGIFAILYDQAFRLDVHITQLKSVKGATVVNQRYQCLIFGQFVSIVCL